MESKPHGPHLFVSNLSSSPFTLHYTINQNNQSVLLNPNAAMKDLGELNSIDALSLKGFVYTNLNPLLMSVKANQQAHDGKDAVLDVSATRFSWTFNIRWEEITLSETSPFIPFENVDELFPTPQQQPVEQPKNLNASVIQTFPAEQPSEQPKNLNASVIQTSPKQKRATQAGKTIDWNQSTIMPPKKVNKTLPRHPGGKNPYRNFKKQSENPVAQKNETINWDKSTILAPKTE